MIKILPSRFWNQLEDIFEKEFDSDLPETGEIFISTEGSRRTGFILVEPIRMVGQIYVYEDFRKDSVKNAMKLVKHVQNLYQGSPVGTVASEARFEKLYRLMGMDKIEGTFFRKN
jgi:hypothetical protein